MSTLLVKGFQHCAYRIPHSYLPLSLPISLSLPLLLLQFYFTLAFKSIFSLSCTCNLCYGFSVFLSMLFFLTLAQFQGLFAFQSFESHSFSFDQPASKQTRKNKNNSKRLVHICDDDERCILGQKKRK